MLQEVTGYNFNAHSAGDLKSALLYQIQELFAGRQNLFLSHEQEAPLAVALFRNFPGQLAEALESGLISSSATLSQAAKDLGDF